MTSSSITCTANGRPGSNAACCSENASRINRPATDTRRSSPVVDALRQRRSVRAFTDRPVDSALLAEVFAAAQRAPSGGNLQPWQATILTGEPWQAMQDAVAARIAMGREGRQMEYDIYPPALGRAHV